MPHAAPTLNAPDAFEDQAPRTLTVLVAPGDPTGYPITHPYIEKTGTHAIFGSGECPTKEVRR